MDVNGRFLRNSLNRSWLILIGLTLITTALAESGTLTTLSVAFIAVIAMAKGRLIIREYMEMKAANPLLYWGLMAYVAVFTAAMALLAAKA